MTALTTKYSIQYAVLADTVASLAGTIGNLAQRVDLLLGESGVWNPSLVANTAQGTAISLSRTYPGNSTGPTTVAPGVVIVTPFTPQGSGVTVFTWVNAWTGTSTTVTGFTLNAIASVTAARTFHWRFIPVP
jgi:hypothetical protein